MPIELRVNGEVKQDSSTAKMIFTVAELVAFYGRVLSLEVGDVIATGTAAGVGAGAQPPQFLAARRRGRDRDRRARHPAHPLRRAAGQGLPRHQVARAPPWQSFVR